MLRSIVRQKMNERLKFFHMENPTGTPSRLPPSSPPIAPLQPPPEVAFALRTLATTLGPGSQPATGPAGGLDIPPAPPSVPGLSASFFETRKQIRSPIHSTPYEPPCGAKGGAGSGATYPRQSRASAPAGLTCPELRARGGARRGEPGYRSDWDGDHDGIACEPYRSRRR